LAGAFGEPGVVVAPDGFIHQPRDDLAVAVGEGCMGQDAADHQRGLLHRTFEHRRILFIVVWIAVALAAISLGITASGCFVLQLL
jgi:hypothetical protein